MTEASFHPDDRREETDDELVAYLDGELTAEQSQKIELRLASDPGYRERLRELERTWDLLDELPTGEPTESFTRSTIELVLSEDVQLQRKKQRKTWTVPLRLLAFSALPLALFGGAYSVTRSLQNQPYQELLSDLPVIENVDLFNKVDDIRFLELLDQEGLFGDGMGGSNQ
ncbi:MAG: anti-sigma factor family protein [Planctomycetota bacterium]